MIYFMNTCWYWCILGYLMMYYNKLVCHYTQEISPDIHCQKKNAIGYPWTSWNEKKIEDTQ
jgi:hypothetical protein